MSQITVRGIEPGIEQKIRRMASQSGKSMNQVLKEILHKNFEKTQKEPGEALKRLAGGWGKEDAAEFERAISSCEQIDEEMWR